MYLDTYLALSGTLNYRHFEQIVRMVTIKGDEYTLNLEKINFIEPYGLVGLIIAARFCKNKGAILKIILPQASIQKYMATMNFFNHIKEYQNVNQGIISYLQLKKPERPLLELTKLVMKDFKEIGDFTDLLDKRMEMMFSNAGKHNDLGSKRITTNLLEVCQNIEHSLDFGYVTVQKYKAPLIVKIGVMDLGIGITKALQGQYDKKGEALSDKRAIGLALQSNISSRPTGGGLGLYRLSTYVRNHPGSELIIRNGTAKCHLKHNGIIYEENLTFFPGTQLGLVLKA